MRHATDSFEPLPLTQSGVFRTEDVARGVRELETKIHAMGIERARACGLFAQYEAALDLRARAEVDG